MFARRDGGLGRLVPAVVALALSAGTFALTAQPVRAEGAYYTAALAAPLAAPKQVIEGGLLWHCAGDSCTAARDTSRPAIVCARLARSVGEVARFATPKGDLAAEDLARCNGKPG
ncbi:MAG: hypothetical protein RIS94_2373 [Pseudomonadota bacterium]|jgi:hypothetical protein